MKNPKILVVDDDRDNLVVVTYQLLALGYDVEIACDGYEAFEKIIRNPPQLILLDVFIPNMSGLELSEKLKQNPGTCAIPIIAMSGFHEFGQGYLRQDLKTDDFIRKPVRIEEAMVKIDTLLKKSEEHDTNTFLQAAQQRQ